MAEVVVTRVIDDLDGGDITDDEGGGRVSFALQGCRYEIDLSAENVCRLQEALQPFIDVARSVGARPKSHGSPAADSAKSKRRTSRRSKGSRRQQADRRADIREWARIKGYSVADRGRINNEIVNAYDAQRNS